MKRDYKKISIYITSDLKEAMDKRADISWSKIARKAFKEALEREASKELEYGVFIEPPGKGKSR